MRVVKLLSFFGIPFARFWEKFSLTSVRTISFLLLDLWGKKSLSEAKNMALTVSENVPLRKSRYSWPVPSRFTSGCLPVQMQYEIGTSPYFQLRRELRKSAELLQRLQIETKLESHTGCVNALDWSDDGFHLASGSDDVHLVIWDVRPKGKQVPFRFKSLHPDNIFSVKFLCNSDARQLVSSSGDGMVVHTQLTDSKAVQNNYKCHTGTVYRVVPFRESSTCFMSCSEDGTVRLFDTRQPTSACTTSSSCAHLLINMEKAVSSLALNPVRSNEIAVGCADSTITFYDRRKVSEPMNRIRCQTTKNMPRRITSLQYDMYGNTILANILCEKIQLLDLHVKDQLKDGNAKKLDDPKDISHLDSPSCSAGDRHGGSFATKRRNDIRFPSEPLPIKRLRLRGDWSDTGPQSRPGQRPAEATTGTSRFMVEISDLMTTWMRNQMAAPTAPTAAASPAASRAPLVAATERSGGGGRNDSGIEDLLSSAASRAKKLPDDLVVLKPVLEYSGHRSSRTMIKEASFWDDSFVISGSDCGRVFIWNRHTGKLVNVMEGDKHVVNCVRPHPTEFALATSGIDHDVKIWRPASEESTFDAEAAQAIMETNNQMLEETRDTVTVPAVCVVKILRAMAQRSQQGERERQGRLAARNEPTGGPQAGGSASADSSDSEED